MGKESLVTYLQDHLAGSAAAVEKETTAWLGAKLSRFRLGRELSADLGTLEALEVVAHRHSGQTGVVG